ncbi:contractile injection system tape measure protein [Janthinobacterium sp. P210005]|uniref:contractile injection system tape measure protein n=1 Tax=Janthinobacterium sp. P210005 TaxID=3112938 RepID=UPI002E2656E8|nr:contractile injection system tape measure protein [Janthinobacterium sp. P210005]
MNDAVHATDIADIGNAGLALLHPFLPAMFQRLDLLATGGDGRPQLRGEHGARAVHLLQYLVDGRSDAPEQEQALSLNKLLCGLPLDFPAPPVDLGQDELTLCDQLLHAVIVNWPASGSVSITALRATFLQRAGRLQWRGADAALAVQRKTVDVLMHQLPWSMGIIRHPWMRQPLHVTW